MNERKGDRVIYRGHKSNDEGDPLDFLTLLPPGAAIPDKARQALSQTTGSRHQPSLHLGLGAPLAYRWVRIRTPSDLADLRRKAEITRQTCPRSAMESGTRSVRYLSLLG